MQTLIPLFALLIITCNKSNNNATASKKDLLPSGSWKLTSVDADEDASGSYETDRGN